MFAFAGPAYLVSVGYMDPGNWATDLEGGARFGYQLLWVLVMSNAMAVLLQTLSARLGIVRGRDLAQACRETYPRPVNLALWGLCEIAVAACDLAEVLGAAIGLNLLFHIPLLAGVMITAADTLLLLWFQSFGIRTIEATSAFDGCAEASCRCNRHATTSAVRASHRRGYGAYGGRTHKEITMPQQRERIDTGTDKRFVRRDEQGRFKESTEVGRSPATDRRTRAKTVVPKGQGDRGDKKKS